MGKNNAFEFTSCFYVQSVVYHNNEGGSDFNPHLQLETHSQ